jgi:hypothetical protein
MNDSQLALFRRIKSVVTDMSKRIDHLEANARDEWPIYRDSVIRLLEMKREVNDIISTIHEELENLTPNIQVNSDRHLEDLQERLVALQTQLNTYRWQYGGQ